MMSSPAKVPGITERGKLTEKTDTRTTFGFAERVIRFNSAWLCNRCIGDRFCATAVCAGAIEETRQPKSRGSPN